MKLRLLRWRRQHPADRPDTEDDNLVFAIEYEHFKCLAQADLWPGHVGLHSERCLLQ